MHPSTNVLWNPNNERKREENKLHITPSKWTYNLSIFNFILRHSYWNNKFEIWSTSSAIKVGICLSIYIYIWSSYDKFPDFFRMGTFIDSTHMKHFVSFEVISSSCNALVVPFQQFLQLPMELLLCDHVNDLRHSIFHLLNCLITTASELRE